MATRNLRTWVLRVKPTIPCSEVPCHHGWIKDVNTSQWDELMDTACQIARIRGERVKIQAAQHSQSGEWYYAIMAQENGTGL